MTWHSDTVQLRWHIFHQTSNYKFKNCFANFWAFVATNFLQIIFTYKKIHEAKKFNLPPHVMILHVNKTPNLLKNKICFYIFGAGVSFEIYCFTKKGFCVVLNTLLLQIRPFHRNLLVITYKLHTYVVRPTFDHSCDHGKKSTTSKEVIIDI